VKKYNIALGVVVTIFIFVIIGYIYFIDKMYQNRLVQKEIAELNRAYMNVKKPIVMDLNDQEMLSEEKDIKILIKKFGLSASVSKMSPSFMISGALADTAEYVLLKKFLTVIDSGNYKIDNICLGKECNTSPYGFYIKVTPYKVNFR
jgi:hypothetical protein